MENLVRAACFTLTARGWGLPVLFWGPSGVGKSEITEGLPPKLGLPVVPLSPAEQRALLRMLVPPQGLRPLWIDLLTFALCPALCEELFFRGAILRHLLAARADLPAEMAAWGMQKRATAVVDRKSVV